MYASGTTVRCKWYSRRLLELLACKPRTRKGYWQAKRQCSADSESLSHASARFVRTYVSTHMFVVMMIHGTHVCTVQTGYSIQSCIIFMMRRCIIRYGGISPETLVFGVCKAHGSMWNKGSAPGESAAVESQRHEQNAHQGGWSRELQLAFNIALTRLTTDSW